MKYRPEQYAEALYGTLEGKSPAEQKELIQRFSLILRKNKDSAKIPLILTHFEKKYTEANGLTKIHLESAHPITPLVKAEVEKVLGNKAFIKESVNPNLLAGIRILLDDSVFIDSSALHHINNLFAK